MGGEGVSGERGETEMGIEAGSEEHIQTGLHSLHHMHMYNMYMLHQRQLFKLQYHTCVCMYIHVLYMHTCTCMK